MNKPKSTTRTTRPSLTDVDPDTLEQWLRDDDTVLIDVREAFEYAEERIDGARAVPLSRFDPESVRSSHAGKRVVFQCRTGERSARAAARFGADGDAVFHLAGGLEGWKASGRACMRPESAPRIGVMRQVQITAGSLVAVGVALGVFVSPGFLVIPAFVGCGLLFAGLSGWCGMAMLLAKMPWNRSAAASCATD